MFVYQELGNGLRMILSKIVIHGFKSFAKKTELHFDGRITAIVGPNGCGKTNIVDAIRWALGEQKPSVLRTDRMENIIFGGAHSSRPLGMAEVSVFFDNSDHLLPIDYTEVVVTRRLYRSGESEYLLNKTPVRLKDINDLFMDTGVGADAYSVIELKMLEDILSDKAEDRRKLLEEAAGVTKYKHRLKAAVRKLDATRNDLLRVNDIIGEVERSVSSLKRQGQRAKRYQIYQEKIKELELKSGQQIFARLKRKIEPLKKELESFKKQKEGRTTKITREEADLESLRLNIVEQEKALVKAREELSTTVELIHQKEGDIRVGRERISSLEEKKIHYSQEIEKLKKRLEQNKLHLGVALSKRESLQVKITSTGRIFNNKKKELEVFQQGLNLKRLELNGKKKEIIECLEEINRLSGEETRLRAKMDNSRGRLERLDEEDTVSTEVISKIQENKKEFDRKIHSLQLERSKILQERNRIIEAVEKLRKTIELEKENLYKSQGDLDVLQGKLLFLRNVVESREGVTDGAKKLLREKPEGLLGVLPDLLETSPEHRKAIEAGLGEALHYLLFEKASHAFSALGLLKRMGGGRVAMVALDRVEALPEQKTPRVIPQNVESVGWANDLVKCDKKLSPILNYLLGDLLVVKSLDGVKKTVDVLSEKSIRVVTLQGELATGWGVIQTSESREKDIGMIGRLQRIKELEKETKRLQEKISTVEKQLTERETEYTFLLKKKEKIEKTLSKSEEKIAETEKQQARVQFEKEKAEERLGNNAEERQKLLTDIETIKEDLENLRPRMEELIEKREQLENVSTQIQAEVNKLEEEERVKEEEVHRLNLSVVRLNGEAKNLDYDIERSQSLEEEIETTIEQRSREIEEAAVQIEQYKKEIEQKEQELVKDFSKKEAKESQLGEQEESYQKLMEELRNREKEVRQVRRDRDQVSERAHNLEMEIAELEHQAQSLKDRLRESYNVDLEKLPFEEEVDLEEIDRELEELRRKIKAIGPVNLMALDEYEREKERLDFLNQQKDDLLSAEETLKQTIQKINQTARQRFKDVFGTVQKNFRETFCRFFQGGEADLRLPEDEDPLEAQIEIIARPAGKHFRDLSLLSAGERALTAISLLFAIYLVKPSPFCILDEIDAPLDEANIERFARVVSEYAERTQFIIVTHNKMTMRIAKTLYGVTMEEHGVSKVVSVKFEDNE